MRAAGRRASTASCPASWATRCCERCALPGMRRMRSGTVRRWSDRTRRHETVHQTRVTRDTGRKKCLGETPRALALLPQTYHERARTIIGAARVAAHEPPALGAPRGSGGVRHGLASNHQFRSIRRTGHCAFGSSRATSAIITAASALATTTPLACRVSSQPSRLSTIRCPLALGAACAGLQRRPGG